MNTKKPATQRVLLVDDDPAVLRAMVRVAGGIPDVEVRTASTVEEALRVIAEWPPDAVVSDVDLGAGGNGFDLCAALMFSGTPIALASGQVSEVRDAHAAALSAPLYEKPIDVREVVDRLLQASVRVEAEAWFEEEERREGGDRGKRN